MIAEDRSGMLWPGTEGGGISLLDRYKQQFTHYQQRPTDPTSLNGNQVYAIAEDRAGYWWIGTDGGLNQLDRRTGQFVHYRHDPDDPTSLSDGRHRHPRFKAGGQEIFAVQVLPNTHYPEILEWDDERVGVSYVLPDAALAETPRAELIERR